ncbi:MAG: ABC transporter substrate-binding protein [Oceanospirillaceae bacterium]|nr:ABC transporter substrate-binding protein [Oceanospirillaceae bacterium]
MNNYLASFTVLIIALSAATQADSLTVAFGKSKAPFVFKENGEWRGIEIDIVRAALEHVGHDIKDAAYVSNRRLAMAIPKMDLDVAVTISEAENRIFYSDNFITFKNYAISRTTENLNIQSIKDLANYSFVTWQNAVHHLGPEFKKLFMEENSNYHEYAEQAVQNTVFWHKRYDVILVDKNIFLWHKKQLKDKVDTNIAVTYHNILPSSLAYKVGFKTQRIRDDFNRGLQYLRSSGQYQALFDKYIQ